MLFLFLLILERLQAEGWHHNFASVVRPALGLTIYELILGEDRTTIYSPCLFFSLEMNASEDSLPGLRPFHEGQCESSSGYPKQRRVSDQHNRGCPISNFACHRTKLPATPPPLSLFMLKHRHPSRDHFICITVQSLEPITPTDFFDYRVCSRFSYD